MSTPTTDPWREAAELLAQDYAQAHNIPGNKCACSTVNRKLLAGFASARFAPLRAKLAGVERERDALREQLRWRPCRDSLPPMGDKVLVAWKPGGVDVAKLGASGSQGLFWENADWNRDVPVDECAIAYWMPLPKEPAHEHP